MIRPTPCSSPRCPDRIRASLGASAEPRSHSLCPCILFDNIAIVDQKMSLQQPINKTAAPTQLVCVNLRDSHRIEGCVGFMHRQDSEITERTTEILRKVSNLVDVTDSEREFY